MGKMFKETPWYQPYVVSISVGSFLLYFLYLREESDLDDAVAKPLWEHVDGMTPDQASQMIAVDKSIGFDTELSTKQLKQYSSSCSSTK